MTKISNQYSLTNILTADLANSRLGINNVSPTVALDVTGAGKFSGASTFLTTVTLGTGTAGSALLKINQPTNDIDGGIRLQSNGGDNGGMFHNGTSLVIREGGVNTMYFDGSNVGIGVTPSAGWVQGKALEVGFVGSGIWGRYADEVHFTNNYYFSTSTNSRLYANTAPASDYEQYNGTHVWYTAPSGTAGTALTFTERFKIANTGAATFSSSVTMGGDLVLTPTDSAIGFSSGAARFFTGGSERLRISSTGNVGIGTTSPGEQLVLQRDTYPTVKFIENTNSFSGYLQYHSASNEFRLTTVTNRPLVFSTNDGERMRITASGNVSIGNTADDYKLEVRTSSTNYTAMFRNTSSTTSNGVYVYFDSSSSGTSQAFYRGESGAGVKALIYTNGSYGSATGTYGSIVSDLRLKENISEATSKLNDILRLRVVNFNITADLDKKKQIGFIAQEFKEVFPSLVFETDTREYDKNGNVIKGYENAMGLSVGMEFAILTKAIQELSAKVSLLENK